MLSEKLSSKRGRESCRTMGLPVHIRFNGDGILDNAGDLGIVIPKLRAIVEVGRPAYDDAVVGNEYLLMSAPVHEYPWPAYF